MNLFIQFLTYFRIFIAPVIFILITQFDLYGWALSLFILASISDYWDGLLARKYQLESTMGAILDPIADKILVTFLILALSLELSSIYIGLIGGLILVREFWVGALRNFNARNNNNEATKVSLLSKAKTTIQFFTFTFYLSGLYSNSALLLFISNLFLFLALIITLQTGLSYTIASFRK
ncbi:putative CDP-diacylglycerol--glycerol-3-phosphate 3-phosphatidyltransferase [SAR86 cluster bacterium SAR86E]|uniref:CDP-diacylglycerol--glycerol-3-phosphate 3-phosphatidyltransferase n=1 Tax=SAR86 cluster bacterium SAR86E TaxID=1208365 RepID=K6H115_9GAMM|nr:putative CDP-diacylglycerol--glycerol-3-phosphate 3-phosphatidyltransferase [SAR86 cluster bacterium SAR86E]